MADIYVRHISNFNKTVKFNITLRSFVDVSSEGNPIWTLEIGTVEKDKYGKSIPPSRLHIVPDESTNFDGIIEQGVSKIAKVIDWSPKQIDVTPPECFDITPIPGSSDVSIFTNVHMRILDSIPSTGIVLDNMKVTINNGLEDFDITSEVVVTGDPYEYFLVWKPKLRIFSTYA